MMLHSLLGYVTVGLAGLGFVLALVALLSRSQLVSQAMYAGFVLCLLLQLPALITGVLDNATFATTAAWVAPYNFFVGGSFFTLTGTLVVWRGVNPGVLWDKQKWLIYQAAALGNILLGGALIGLGHLALGNG